MKAVLQRVTGASVSVEGEITGKISTGWVVFLGVERGDLPKDYDYILDKVLNLRGFPDSKGRMNHSVLQLKGEVLVVSQFTLLGDCKKGRRPSFGQAAEPKEAEATYDRFCEDIESMTGTRQNGVFGASMSVLIENSGPVTFILDSRT